MPPAAPTSIKACLFDMGNVLVRFSHDRMHAQMSAVLGLGATEIRDLLALERRQWRYEAGLVSTDELFALLAASAGRPFARAELEHAVSDIFEPIAASVALARELKALGLRLVLVSNTNVLHLEFIRERFDVLAPFDALVLSYVVKAMKPDAAFYTAAVQAADCAPDETVFIDDLPENVEGARRHGMHGVVFTDAAALRRDLGRLGILPNPNA